jgi:hypothetical protein
MDVNVHAKLLAWPLLLKFARDRRACGPSVHAATERREPERSDAIAVGRRAFDDQVQRDLDAPAR